MEDDDDPYGDDDDDDDDDDDGAPTGGIKDSGNWSATFYFPLFLLLSSYSSSASASGVCVCGLIAAVGRSSRCLFLAPLLISALRMLDDAPDYEEKRFQVLTKSDITNIQEKMVTELSGQLGLSKGETALVLILFEYAPTLFSNF